MTEKQARELDFCPTPHCGVPKNRSPLCWDCFKIEVKGREDITPLKYSDLDFQSWFSQFEEPVLDYQI